MRLRKHSRPYQILKYLALGSGFLILSTISPLGGAQSIRQLIRLYFRKRAFERHRFLNDLKNLQRRELIKYREMDNSKIEIALTKNGKEKFLTYQIDNMALHKSSHWDQKWRLVMFDIPHFQKKARDAFRRKLKDLKFYPLQKSVFITPYPCEDEIDFLSSIFNVRKHVLLLYVSNFEGAEKLKYYFKI